MKATSGTFTGNKVGANNGGAGALMLSWDSTSTWSNAAFTYDASTSYLYVGSRIVFCNFADSPSSSLKAYASLVVEDTSYLTSDTYTPALYTIGVDGVTLSGSCSGELGPVRRDYGQLVAGKTANSAAMAIFRRDISVSSDWEVVNFQLIAQ
ncbi:hypothetical protein K461DRAFT_282890 [Myriangium duriaei CBS 260.36]|uniref:Uncharacterized protein n=1 Tax=Myriangium duriaei CBS 260.36 TaxID=1168546 RepID=A0A9P4IU49_9PEZI|nr:hypothetical protein K461DRAFT_282890 [Myriangium duriaei CBS 260.36]